MRNLLLYFSQAVAALGFHRSETPPSAAPAKNVTVRAAATAASDPVFHDEEFLRTLLGALHASSPRVKATYDTWLYYSRPDEEKRTAHFNKVFQQQDARRAADHARQKTLHPNIPDLAPLRDDERKCLRLSTDHSFGIQAQGAKREFVHQMQSFLLSLHVEGSRSLPRQNPGYLRQEFSFKPLPESKENTALIHEVRASYSALRHEIETRADDLLLLMDSVVRPVKAPLAVAMEQIVIRDSTLVDAPLPPAGPPDMAENIQIVYLPTAVPAPAVQTL